MRCVDVNVLVYAHRPESPDHLECRAWLDEARSAHELLGLSDSVLSGFLRVVTHPRIFREPSPLGTAIDFAEGLLRSPAASYVTPGERHWGIFIDLCQAVGARGNVVPDASLAALAIEQGATLVTADRSFGRFPGLRWQHPLDG
jgi:toxin-antitoxin system PIN domain toxin